MKSVRNPHPWKQVAAAAVLAIAGIVSVGPAVAAKPVSGGVAWQVASSDAEVDKAFAAARQAGKPVYLYWGAVWCPPCNQVKATLFNRADFVERSRAFVAVYVDGDKPGAQKVASRFKVSGYPTMILFKPDGTEITRLPGEVDPERYLLTLSAGLNAQTPVKELLQRAGAKQPLAPEQWRLLAFYSWDTDEQQVLATSELPSRLAELAAAVPAELPAVRDRIALKALVAQARLEGGTASDADRRLVERVLADESASRELWDLLVGQGARLVKYLAPAGDARVALATKWDHALARLAQAGLPSRSDQVDALDTRVSMWKFIDGGESLSSARRQTVLREVAMVVAASTDRYERQAVVPSAAYVLRQAGLLDESDAMLKAELPRAVAPYYHMLGLAGNAKQRKDTKAALEWYETAWRKSEGPATRIQWGTNYLGNVIDLTPADSARVAAGASALVAGLEPKGETFYERNLRSLQRLAKRMVAWQGTDPARAKVVTDVKAQLAKTCAKLPAKDSGRANCERVFSGESVASS